jgi:hypothetical protein
MEDQSKYSRKDKIRGLTEVIRFYYDKNNTSVDELILLEYAANLTYLLTGGKPFRALNSKSLGPLMICKN